MHLRNVFGRQTFYSPDGDPGAPPPPSDGWKAPATEAELKALLDQEFGKGKRLGAESSALAKAEREKLAELEKFRDDRVKAEKEAEIKRSIEKGDLEKSRELIIKSAQDEKVKEYEPKLTEAQERIKRLEGRFDGMLKAEVKAAAAGKAYNVDQVVALLVGHRVRLDADFQPEVIDDAGQPALVGGKPMTIQQLVDGYLDANPNLVRSAGGKGAGANGGASLNGGVDTSEIAALQKTVDDLAKKYQSGRNLGVLTEHRAAVARLNEAKLKAAK